MRKIGKNAHFCAFRQFLRIFSDFLRIFCDFLRIFGHFCQKKCRNLAETGGGDGRAAKIRRGGGVNKMG